MQIENIKITDLKPYDNNPRDNENAVQYVMESINQFGFKVPIVIDKNNVIVCGHTRYKASKRLKLKEIPCIRADDLTEEQIRAFRVADNKVSEFAQWDFGKLEEELQEITIDMSSFGFNLDPLEEFEIETDDDGYYGDERERTNNAYHLHELEEIELTDDFYQMPIIKNDGLVPSDLIGFNYAKTYEDKEVGVHFYVDDYQFERIWNYPEKYVDILLEYDCILSPDFSLYMDMPMSMKIWNTYRSRFVGAYYQSKGINVIPTISWAEVETYDFCFLGIPEGSIVSISTVGVKENKDAFEVWKNGTKEMIERIKPSTILVYGGKVDFDYGDIDIRYFENKVIKNWK